MFKLLKASKLENKINKIVVQGNNLEIRKIFELIAQALCDEFTEDNNPTQFCFMMECAIKAMQKQFDISDACYEAILLEVYEECKNI